MIRFIGLSSLAALLFCVFHANALGTADDARFRDHERRTDGYILHRALATQQGGPFSQQGYLVMPRGKTTPDMLAAFYAGQVSEPVKHYKSQIGLHAQVLGLVGALFSLKPFNVARVGWVFTALAMALTLLALCWWARLEFGLWPALVLGVFSVGSPWLVVFGRTLWYSTWTLFLPFVVVALWARRETFWQPSATRRVFAVAAGLGLLKASVGYEFVTTALIALLWGLLYSVMQREGGAARLGVVALGFVTGVGMIVVCHLLWLWHGEGSVAAAFDTFHTFVAKRTDGDPLTLPAAYQDSLLADYGPVLKQYLFEGQIVFGWSAAALLAATGVAMAVWLRDDESAKARALATVTLLSPLAPLSWYVLAKPAAYIHSHTHYILWSLPVIPLCAIVIGLATQTATRRLPRRQLAAVVLAGLIALTGLDRRMASKRFEVLCKTAPSEARACVSWSVFDAVAEGTPTVTLYAADNEVVAQTSTTAGKLPGWWTSRDWLSITASRPYERVEVSSFSARDGAVVRWP